MEIVTLIGNIGRDAEKRSANGRDFYSFTLACNSKVGDLESTNWYDCTTNQEVVAKYLKKGTQVTVLGRFSINRYKDNSGNPQIGLRCAAMQIQLVGAKKTEDEQQTSQSGNGASSSGSASEGNQVQMPVGADDGLPF